MEHRVEMDALHKAAAACGESQAPFPHCDPRVLHEPGTCIYCDKFPHYHALRRIWGINFTGGAQLQDDLGSKMLPCPSDYNRGPLGAHIWYGNRPHPPEECLVDMQFEPRE